MLAYAIARGVCSIQGGAEALPFKDAVFDYGLVVTTICFVDDPKTMLHEAHRVLKSKAPLVTGFVDRNSALGQQYLTHQDENVFYRAAQFYSTSEIENLLGDTGFVDHDWGANPGKTAK
jgi:ubiquinone/menaquinone biosynthesis C-methylase UbiE